MAGTFAAMSLLAYVLVAEAGRAIASPPVIDLTP
jgi:hypothetical protein